MAEHLSIQLLDMVVKCTLEVVVRYGVLARTTNLRGFDVTFVSAEGRNMAKVKAVSGHGNVL